ncbi:hypothetical protein L227DRAFT_196781 [Lentinus tigrinus ALCF2SS1-6]|uniref:Uncharacterized protein n=1 Tax=Lentinus tigrinus ALCF2SS1-6 TaxID=1328759 RepID=A0A5C2S3Q1_9APHY|nr:hypothetical protein L227DRAFT_196781 [Lentinus tigrinus ALCF2SS1-6]
MAIQPPQCPPGSAALFAVLECCQRLTAFGVRLRVLRPCVSLRLHASRGRPGCLKLQTRLWNSRYSSVLDLSRREESAGSRVRSSRGPTRHCAVYGLLPWDLSLPLYQPFN